MHLWIQCMMTGVLPAGFPHSDIRGSVDICSSPRLFAAYHVFLRLSVPRHPPCALSCLTFCPSPCSVMATAVLLLRSLYKICKSFLFSMIYGLMCFLICSFQGTSARPCRAMNIHGIRTHPLSRAPSGCVPSLYIQFPLRDLFFISWQPPALPCRLQQSTIGRLSLNRRVRDGNGCVP